MEKTYILSTDAGRRIDQFLAEQKQYFSRTAVKRAFGAQKIFLNGKELKNLAYRLKTGDFVEYEALVAPNYDLQPVAHPLEILFEDDSLLVVFKPSGLLTHPTLTKNEVSLVHYLLHHSQNLAKTQHAFRPGIVHRLDKETSGLLVVAKTEQALVHLTSSFKNRWVEKIYLAFVGGKVPFKQGTLNWPIGRHPTHRKKFSCLAKIAKPAVTHYQILAQNQQQSLVKIQLETGRTHQIRVHFHHFGHAVLGDAVYQGKKYSQGQGTKQNNFAGFQPSHQLLHAFSLGFPHPITGEFLRFFKTPEEDFMNATQSVFPEIFFSLQENPKQFSVFEKKVGWERK